MNIQNVFFFLLIAVCISAAEETKTEKVYKFLVFPENCLDRFLAFDIEPTCIKKTISKVLGLAIVVFSTIMKLP